MMTTYSDFKNQMRVLSSAHRQLMAKAALQAELDLRQEHGDHQPYATNRALARIDKAFESETGE